MSKKMLIDASHPEETRVVIVDGTRVEELDFESQNKRQLRGNVYLARVTRVEPSLQAAFVEYGGNRHGFLAFSEIHPDYYQIPFEDRMALIKAEEAENIADEELEVEDAETATSEDGGETPDASAIPEEERAEAEDSDDEEVADEQNKVASSRRKRMSRRRYKIQEVIKRGQILLIQAVKEERGNKGAAMTTYLSLAGRYCVLMPNTPRGGGISRKIANGSDRKRLKSIMSDLEVPQGMGVIVRTAGAKRTKVEIKRDYDYLSRLWSTIRDTTMKSIAPALIHEEGDLVKRSIRDLYNKDIEEILVQGDDAYKLAKDFIKMLMPSHAKNVKAYKDDIPLFLRYQVEKQIENGLNSVVQLKSGGYLVIHPTEALVSVDVNSGKSTRERNVERTALKTNLEAADEVARQMRLRDLAGLVVIDFIDMDENKNNRAVEKRMKDALARDRARVQYSKISQFGLMEISRQRRRRSLLEGSTASCEHCDGVGRKRTVESSALAAIRAIEEVGVRRQMRRVRLKVPADVAIYIFNEKRDLLQSVDDQFDMFTELVGDDTLIRPAFIIETIEEREGKESDPLTAIEEEQKKAARHDQNNRRRKPTPQDDDTDEDDKSEKSSENRHEDDSEGDGRKRRRRRGRRGGRGKRNAETQGSENSEETSDSSDTRDETSDNVPKNKSDNDASDAEKPKRSRRSSSRRRAPSRNKNTDTTEAVETQAEPQQAKAPEADKPRSTARRKAPSRKTPETTGETEAPVADSEKPSKPSRKSATRKAPARKKAAADKTEDQAPAKSRTRKAPVRKSAATEDTDADTTPPKRKRAAPKSKKAAPEVTESTVKLESRAPSRRKAPGRKTESVDTPEAPEEAAPKKAATRKKAPAKKATAKPAAKKATAKAPKEEASEAEAPKAKKAPARRKAPARKAAPKRAETPADEKVDSPKKAPAKRATSKAKSVSAEKVAEPDATADDKPKKKASRRNWFGLKKDD